MEKIKTTYASLSALTIAAVLVSGCLPEDPDGSQTYNAKLDQNLKKGWALAWQDEFDGDAIDDSKWAYEVNCWGGGNNEEQCYVEDPDNAFVGEGLLHIKAIREEHTGAVFNVDHADYDPAQMNTKTFTSTRLRSVSPTAYVENQDPGFNFKNDWKYGRFEIRAKLPEGQGTWPAIWMLPTDWEFGGWAMSGEIDIMEAVNLKADAIDEETGEVFAENRVLGTLHYGRAWPGNVYSGVEYDFGDRATNPADAFHVYAIEWEEGAIRWFIDGDHFATQTQEGWYTHYQDENGDWQTGGTTAAPFDQNFHLIMNLAIGGAWAAKVNEGGVDAAINEAEMIVDYVRVYQCEDDTSGIACGSKGEEGSYTLESGIVEPELPVAADFTADPLVIFGSNLAADWQLAKWDDADGGDEYEVIDGYIDLQFSNTGVMYLYSDQGKLDDFSTYAGDYTFKMRWVDGAATGLKVGFSNASGSFAHIVLDQQYFGVSGSDEWTDVTIPVADMLTNAPGFDLTTVDIAGKFEQVGGTDLHVQIKDIEMSKGEYVPVEEEALGFELDLLADAIAEGYDALLYHGYNEDSTDTISVVAGVMAGTHVGGGNISIGSTSGAVDMSVFENGQMNFELRVVNLGTATDILVKMDGGWPNVGDVALGETTTGLPSDNEWHSYTVDVADFVANNNRLDGSGNFVLTNVINSFVIEAFGGGDLQVEVRNVNFNRPLVLLTDAIAEGFDAYLYHGYNEGATDTINLTAGVLNGTHVGGGNISIGAASGTVDLTSLANANMVFDLRIVDLGNATDVLVKIDSGWPNIGDVALSETTTGLPADSNWASFVVPVADFVANNNRLDGSGVLNLSAVINAFVVEAVGTDLQVEVRNVSFQF